MAEEKTEIHWSFAVFWLDAAKPSGMRATRASAPNLPEAEAVAECARLRQEQPEIDFRVWFDRLLPSDAGVTVEEWTAQASAPLPQRIEGASATPEAE